MPAPTTVRSFSKINLGLRIGPPRGDGFHHLTTVYQTLALHDTVTVAAERADATAITLTCSDPRVPCDARNTAWRMVELALAQMQTSARVHVHLEKTLPPQGGMGAGSANAVAALLGLERQLGDALPPARRLQLAEAIGSDVPLFLLGGTVFGHNRGELVLPFPSLPRTHCLVVAPTLGSSTPAAFRAWDERISRLTPMEAHDRLTELNRVYASAFAPAGNTDFGGAGGSIAPSPEDLTGASGVSAVVGTGSQPATDRDLAGNPLLELVRTGIENDFEEVVFQQHPSLRAIKHALQGESISQEASSGGTALLAMLSGSGSSVFGLYRTEADAVAAQQRVSVLSTGARTFLTHTVSRDEYWETIFMA